MLDRSTPACAPAFLRSSAAASMPLRSRSGQTCEEPMGDADQKLTSLRVAPRALHKQAEIASHERALLEARPETFRKPFGEPWDSDYWIKWATITEALRRLGVNPPATILDVGCGS